MLIAMLARAARPIVHPALALLLLPLLAPATTVWEDEESYVRLESAERGAEPNDHPIMLTEGQLAEMLAALQVTRRKGSGPVPLFSGEELAMITPHLVEAFARASAGEDIWFRSRGAHSESLFGVGRKLFVSEGLLFYKDGRLNVIFNRLQETARKRNVYGQRDEDFYSARDPSRRREAKFDKVTLSQVNGVFLKAVDDGLRQDWVEIDPGTARPAAGRAGAPAQAASGSAEAGSRAPAAGVPGDAGADAGAAGAGAAAASASTRETAGTAPAGRGEADAAPGYVSLEERLRQLKRLRDEGLITEEAYQDKMRELLNEL